MGRTIRDDYIEECIEKYKYIIRIVMRRFRIPYWRREDYYQLGLITLWNCIERYDPERFAPVEDENGDENDPFIGYIYNAIKYTYYAQLQKDRKVADNEIPLSCCDDRWLNELVKGEYRYDNSVF